MFIFVCAIFVGAVMAFILYKTRLGIILRASVNDREMTNILGVNVPFVFIGVFGFGAALSGFAGVIAGPLLSPFPEWPRNFDRRLRRDRRWWFWKPWGCGRCVISHRRTAVFWSSSFP